MAKKLLILFIFLSFITHPIDDPISGNIIFKRVTFSDIFGALAIMFLINKLWRGFFLSLQIKKVYANAYLMILAFFLPILFSLNKTSTLIENIIVFFLITISILIFFTFKDNVNIILKIIINTSLIASIIGLYEWFANLYNLPTLFPKKNHLSMVSGFRNAGQAGAYFQIMLSILIPLNFSKLKKYLPNKDKIKLTISIIISIIFLISTGKVSAYIGFIIGLFLFILINRKISIIFSFAFISFLMLFIYFNISKIAPDFIRDIEWRVRVRTVDKINENPNNNNDFLAKNWGGAINAFTEHPLFGTGLGAFDGIYEDHEVHSTYLKMLGETGLIGTIFYSIFLISLIHIFYVSYLYRKKNIYFEFLYLITPFMIGNIVSWMYNYHLRKREFWILLSTIMIIYYNAIKQINKDYEQTKNL